MTLHGLTKSTHPPPWWAYRIDCKFVVSRRITFEAQLHTDIIREVKERMVEELNQAIKDYGFLASRPEATFRTINDYADPLSDSFTLSLNVTLPSHVWYSSDCRLGFKPHAVVEGVLLPLIDERRVGCPCAVCNWRFGRPATGGEVGSKGWARVGLEHGWIQESEARETEEEGVAGDADEWTVHQDPPTPATPEPQEHQYCAWCGNEITTRQAIVTRTDSGNTFHVACSAEAREEHDFT